MLRRTDLPEDRTFLRLDLSHEYIPAPTGRIGSSVHLRDPESDPCVKFPVLRPPKAKSRAGNLSDSAPDSVAGLHNFLYDICGAVGDWTMADYKKRAIDSVREKVGGGKVVLFPYDEETYLAERGLYDPLDSLPRVNSQSLSLVIRKVA